MYPLGDTIVALSTPEGAGAIGLIRLSGPRAVDIVQQFCKGQKIQEAKANTLAFSAFKAEEELIDEVVLGFFRAPHSYTKEDVVELSCHGSPFIIQSILNHLIQAGARPAEAGEFTYRAFVNGAMDLSQAEAVTDLIASQNKAQHTLALQQMRGNYSSMLTGLRTELIDFAALLELELDFSEEDVEFAHREKLKTLVESILTQVQSLIDSFRMGNVIKNGVPVAIIGKPNAGKSTLLNQLLQEERAIVSDIAGTTRDVIEDTLTIKGMVFRLIDTAGLRETQDTIEAIGVRKALEKAEKAQIVLYLFDPETETKESVEVQIQAIVKNQKIEDQHIVKVMNKVDKQVNQDAFSSLEHLVAVSAKNGEGIERLKEKMLELSGIHQHLFNQTIVSNTRHLSALDKVEESLTKVLEMMQYQSQTELLAFELRQAIYYLGSITGDISTDDLLGSIFSRFCIGK
jgi:tRNA modification GTPase